MATTPVLKIDATALGGIDFSSFIGDYFADLTSGTNAFYGGAPDIVFGAQYYLNGSQILTRYVGEDGETQSARVALLDGADLAYDFLHYGPAYGHGISGEVDSLTFGEWVEGVTTGTEGIGAAGRVTGLGTPLVIKGFDLSAAPGTGFDPAVNTVYLLYAALRDMDADAIYDVISGYALDVRGSSGADRLTGYAGCDTLRGFKGADTLLGAGGADKLFGGGGSDKLYGGNGADLLAGGAGCDALTGGRGADVFVFAPGAGKDTIRDFETARDHIDLRAFDLGGVDEITILDASFGSKLVVEDVTVRLLGVEAAAIDDGAFLL